MSWEKGIYTITLSALLLSCANTNQSVVKSDDELSSTINLLFEKYVANDWELSEYYADDVIARVNNQELNGYENLIAAGIVLTGGSSKMEGVIELAEEIFHMPVRLGVPQYVDGLVDVVRNPIHATGVGLLLFGKESDDVGSENLGGGSELFNRMKTWFQGW